MEADTPAVAEPRAIYSTMSTQAAYDLGYDNPASPVRDQAAANRWHLTQVNAFYTGQMDAQNHAPRNPAYDCDDYEPEPPFERKLPWAAAEPQVGAEQYRERDGRFGIDGDLDRPCKCGHTLAEHTVGGRDCAATDCLCRKFRHAAARPTPATTAPASAPAVGGNYGHIVRMLNGRPDEDGWTTVPTFALNDAIATLLFPPPRADAAADDVAALREAEAPAPDGPCTGCGVPVGHMHKEGCPVMETNRAALASTQEN